MKILLKHQAIENSIEVIWRTTLVDTPILGVATELTRTLEFLIEFELGYYKDFVAADYIYNEDYYDSCSDYFKEFLLTLKGLNITQGDIAQLQVLNTSGSVLILLKNYK